MKEQKIIITASEKDINDWISRGWSVVSVVAQHVAAASATSYSSPAIQLTGKFCFLLEREK